MFGDLDCPLNASRGLLAIAELLVHSIEVYPGYPGNCLLRRWLQLRFDFDCRSTLIRLQFDRATTILRYGLPVLGCFTAA